MQLTVNNFISAIAEKLVALYPARKVFINEIPQKADGNFHIGVIRAEHGKLLDRRRRTTASFDVKYFLTTHDKEDFHAWEAQMFNGFETLTVEGKVFHLKNLTGESVDRTYHIMFDVEYTALHEADTQDPMEALFNTEVLK